MRLASVVTSLFILLPAAAHSQPVRTFVSTSGLDTNDCSRTTPCRNFTRAVSAVAAEGEVVALDSGGYGPFAIDKPIEIFVPEGVHAAIAPTTGVAISVNVASAESVSLHNLFVKSHGAHTGVQQFNGSLLAENLEIAGFPNSAISFEAVDGAGVLTVRGSLLRNTVVGVAFTASAGNSTVLVENTTFLGIPFATIFSPRTGGRLDGVVRNVTMVRATVGIRVVSDGADSQGFLNVDQCTVIGRASVGSTGLQALTESASPTTRALIRVSDSSITAMDRALDHGEEGTAIVSKGDNWLEGNLQVTTFSSTSPPV